MPFEILRNDITNMAVDVIVNTANPDPVIGAGTDSAVHAKAGPQLLEARKAIGPIAVGSSAITPAFDLSAKYVIHTVGPKWHGGWLGETRLLKKSYLSALALAREHGCKTIAFPLISSGSYGFPKDKALQVAIQAFTEFLTDHEMQIYLVVFQKDAVQQSQKLIQQIRSFVDEHYVEEALRVEYSIPETRCFAPAQIQRIGRSASMPAPDRTMSLEDMLKQADAGFTETLLKLIDKTGKKDSEIYKKANLSKQHFSKIRNNLQYKPTKATALALAVALELDLEETKDLIGRAGYALTNSSKFDLILRYFIQRKQYDVLQINMALYEFDQPLLGA